MCWDFITELSEVVSAVLLKQGYVIRNGFAFEPLRSPANVFDAIVIHAPETARSWGGRANISERSLEEHIAFINLHSIEKAVIIAEDISFLRRCPSLKHINIIPAESVEGGFDFSPLYEHPEIQSLLCATEFGKFQTKNVTVDYSKVHGLQSLWVRSKFDLNYQQIQSLKSLDISGIPFKHLLEIFCSPELDTLQITSCGIRSLAGIGVAGKMQCVYLNYNRSLSDISDLENVASSLRALRIDSCAKITDFSVLDKLENLEFLWLTGSNKLPDLSFIQKMPKLKTLILGMEVLNGDLTPCLSLSYVHCSQIKRHYNVKAKELPKYQYYRGNDNIEPWRRNE